jgi:hypothetical protein
MVEPPRLYADDPCDRDATRPTGEPDLPPAHVEPAHPTVGDTRADDASNPTGEPDPVSADVEASPLRSAPLKFDVQDIPIDDIFVEESRRAVNDDALTALVEDIERIGLQMPITVRLREKVADPETDEVHEPAYVLVTGRHRLEAYRKLGLQHIPAFVRDWDEHEAERWEIAERGAESPEAV